MCLRPRYRQSRRRSPGQHRSDDLSVRDPAWRLRRPQCAAADLLGLPTEPYEQKTYVVCLDLGSSGAVFARGWNPQLEQVGALAKATKRDINTVWIYPPPPELDKLYAAAPAQVMDLAAWSVPINAAAA